MRMRGAIAGVGDAGQSHYTFERMTCERGGVNRENLIRQVAGRFPTYYYWT
jgi:hypothetical protein